MYDNATKDKFIELRAKGLGMGPIAEQLGVHRNTLTDWNLQFGARIQNLRQIELEALQEELLGSAADRFKALAAEFQRYNQELQSRKPQNVPQYMLFRMVCRLRDQVERRIVPTQFLPEPASPPPSPENKP